jgi:predicted patatin/cPLA2 family phospholipase
MISQNEYSGKKEVGIMNLGKVGIILNGGGFTGAYGVGFIKALEAKGIKPVFVQSVSVGVFSGGDLIGTKWDVDALEKKWKETEQLGAKKIFGHSLMGLFKNFRGPNLFSNDGISKYLVEKLDMEAIVASPIEFQIVTYNENKLRHQIFSNHDPSLRQNPNLLKQVMLAAIGLQGFLPPVMINGEWHSDGGTFVLGEAIKAKCDTIFILSNSRLCRNMYADTGRLPWYLRLILRVEFANDLLEIRAIRQGIYRGYKLVENNPCSAFSNVRPLNNHGGKKLKRIINKVQEALSGDQKNDPAPRRIVFLTPTNPISSLSTRKCLVGDITAAIEHASDLANDEGFWSRLADAPTPYRGFLRHELTE